MNGGRQDSQSAFVLHSYAYRETSLVVEVFAREAGRVALVARGARRPKSPLRGVLQAFQPLSLSWFGKAELRTLHGADWIGGVPLLHGEALICGFYLNELLLKLLARDDSHPTLFDVYQAALRSFAGAADYEPILRRFEQRLLKEIGYALSLLNEAQSSVPIDADARYVYAIERGALRKPSAGAPEKTVELAAGGVELRGKTLLDMARDDYSDPLTLLESKLLMRALIDHHLADRTLHTRQLMRDLRQL